MDERERKPYHKRLIGISIVVMLVFLILSINLWRLQIVNGADYSAKALGNVTKIVKVTSTRGDIVDRNGKQLVTSVPVFVLNLDWMNLQQANADQWKEVVKRLAEFIKPYWPNSQQTVESITEDILVNIQNHQWDHYRPVTILDNVSIELKAIIAEHQEELPGVTVDATPLRFYPQKSLSGQVLGYVREISTAEISKYNENEDAQKADFQYSQGDQVGKDGIEKSYDFWLRGTEGVQQVEVDNNARPVSKQMLQEPVAGKTVQLTIDAELQKTVEDSMDEIIADVQKNSTTNAKSGASAVVIDVNTGKILAMASRPGMDPNELTGTISQATSDKYFTNEIAPAASMNRALSGTYAPGSTFKMVTAMAALQLNVTTPDERVRDLMSSLGNLEAQSQGFPEWGNNDFGSVNLTRALAKSSDIYFEVMGRRAFDSNPETVRTIANEFGLGVYSGIDLPGESKGTAPSAEWKLGYFGPINDKVHLNKLAAIESEYAPKLEQAPDESSKQKVQKEKDAKIKAAEYEFKQMVEPLYTRTYWTPFDSYNNAIGQGYHTYTPLQLANYTATLVNGGKQYTPYVVDKLIDPINGNVTLQNEPKVKNTVSVSPEILEAVKVGMAAVTSGEGTANWLFADVPEFSGGAKTGTAQIGNVKTELGEVYNGIFVAFAPYDHPQIAFAAVVELGEHGGDTAGMVAKAAFMKYFGWKSTNDG